MYIHMYIYTLHLQTPSDTVFGVVLGDLNTFLDGIWSMRNIYI